MDISQIDEGFLIDDSIEEYEYHAYSPLTGTNLNNGGEIPILVETKGIWLHPSNSYLLFEGQLTKADGADGTEYASGDEITLCNNGIMHMFESIQYRLENQEIERVNNPGQATTMLGLLTYSNDFDKSHGLKQLWYPDASIASSSKDNVGFTVRQSLIIALPDPKGFFRFIIPLKHIFGFADDYNKVIFGLQHQLILWKRSNDNDAIFRDTGVTAGKVNLTKISWYVPHVKHALATEVSLTNIIAAKKTLSVVYRKRQCLNAVVVHDTASFTWRLSVTSEKPRWVIVAFQTNKKSDQTTNPSIFDHLNLTNISATLNSKKYPFNDYNLNFTKMQYADAYEEAAQFKSKYYRIEDANLNFNLVDYKSLYPIFVIDVSKQLAKAINSTTDLEVNMVFGSNVPVGTMAYAVVISDKIISFQSDGTKLNVIQN